MEVLDGLGDPLRAAEAAAAVAAGLTNAQGATDAALQLIDERVAAIEGLDGAGVALKSLLEAKVGTLIRAGERADDAAEALLRLIESTGAPTVELADGYNGLAIHYAFIGPQSLALLLFDAAAGVAREARDPVRLARALANLCGQALAEDLDRSVRVGSDAVDASRTAGSARWLDLALANLNSARLFTGDWDELLASVRDVEPSEDDALQATRLLTGSAISLARGEPVPAPGMTTENVDARVVIDLVVAQAEIDVDEPEWCRPARRQGRLGPDRV